jgi:hypothetical protein
MKTRNYILKFYVEQDLKFRSLSNLEGFLLVCRIKKN